MIINILLALLAIYVWVGAIYITKAITEPIKFFESILFCFIWPYIIYDRKKNGD